VAGTVGYLGLAVLGWGGFAAFFSHPALIAVVVIQSALALAAFFAGGNLSRGVKEDRGNRWVLAAIIVPSLLQAYLPDGRTGTIFGPSTATPSAGLASCCS
jgi:hypothetical protein